MTIADDVSTFGQPEGYGRQGAVFLDEFEVANSAVHKLPEVQLRRS